MDGQARQMVSCYKNVICSFFVVVSAVRKNKQWFQRGQFVHTTGQYASMHSLMKNPGKAACTAGSGSVPIWRKCPELSRAIRLRKRHKLHCSLQAGGVRQRGRKGGCNLNDF